MVLERQSNADAIKEAVIPDSQKSTSGKIGAEIVGAKDNLASYLNSDSKARDAVNPDAASLHSHDHGRGDMGTTVAAMKPDSQQTLTEKVKVGLNNLGSLGTPNQSKSASQDLKDTITPGADSTLTPKGQGDGVIASVTQMAADARDGVVGAVSGTKQEAEVKKAQAENRA